jgi:light-regulated signal transduction histidine kinase (bacteriophytochrome)
VEERTRELERANRELDAFAYSVSHDLRAPARTMIGFSGILLENPALDAESASHLRRVDAGARQMLRLIDDLLSLSRVSRGDMNRQDLDLSALALEIERELRQADPERRIEFTVETRMRIHADPGLTRILLENLLGNAWKFTSRNAGASIHVGRQSDEGDNAFFVRDNGAGFDMQFAHRMFSAFQRLHRADEFEGTGIGLSIVQRVADKHGGRVWAEGEVDAGATFYFALE